MDSEVKLLPCPFCGSADLRVFGDKRNEAALGGYNVVCGNPGCQSSARHSGDRAKAIRAWNRRPAIAQPSEPDAKDAARYRWLRDPANDEAVSALISIYNYGSEAELTYYGDELDGVIDAAIAAAQ